MSKDIYKELELQYDISQKKIKELESEIEQLKQVIKDNELEDQLEDIDFLTPEEQICIDGIKHLKKLFELGSFTKDDATIFDTLHKNLRMIRGQKGPKERKTKPKTAAELFSIIEGSGSKGSK